MDLPSGVYALSQTVQRGDDEKILHPAGVSTPKGVVLIDTGDPGTLSQIESNLDAAGFDLDDVRGVVLTHQDGDHAGALDDIVERTDAAVYAHERAAPYVDGRKHPIKSLADQRYAPVDIDVTLVGGVSFRTDAGPMDVVYTPGHAPGHVSLYFPAEKFLIVGDALTADENGLSGPNEQYTLNMDEALQSASELAELDVERVLCYHGGFVEDGSEQIRELVASLR